MTSGDGRTGVESIQRWLFHKHYVTLLHISSRCVGSLSGCASILTLTTVSCFRTFLLLGGVDRFIEDSGLVPTEEMTTPSKEVRPWFAFNR